MYSVLGMWVWKHLPEDHSSINVSGVDTAYDCSFLFLHCVSFTEILYTATHASFIMYRVHNPGVQACTHVMLVLLRTRTLPVLAASVHAF